jgi:hypothetical protein
MIALDGLNKIIKNVIHKYCILNKIKSTELHLDIKYNIKNNELYQCNLSVTWPQTWGYITTGATPNSTAWAHGGVIYGNNTYNSWSGNYGTTTTST